MEAELDLLLTSLRELEAKGDVRLGPELIQGSAADVRVAALRQFGRYHKTRAVWGRGGACVLEDPRLALFYANRLEGYPLPPPLPVEEFAG